MLMLHNVRLLMYSTDMTCSLRTVQRNITELKEHFSRADYQYWQTNNASIIRGFFQAVTQEF